MAGRDDLASFLSREAVVCVRLAAVRGSTPREEGTRMFVTADAMHGTIGGGQLEYMAIEEARKLLASGAALGRMDVPLGPEIGQCCGGRVVVTLQRLDAAGRRAALAEAVSARDAWPEVLVFGAGHVGRALASHLQMLPVRAILVDSRGTELGRCGARVELRETPLPETELRRARPGSAFVVLTHDHALDFLLTAEALARGDAAYVGMIGSATKRARFERFARDECAGVPLDALVCPIGAAGSADKRPEVIAAFVAAEVMAAVTGGQVRTASRRAQTSAD